MDSSVYLSSSFRAFLAVSIASFNASLFTSGTAGFSFKPSIASSTACVAASTLSCVAFSFAATFSASLTAAFKTLTDSSVYLSSSFRASLAVSIAIFKAVLSTDSLSFTVTVHVPDFLLRVQTVIVTVPGCNAVISPV